MPQYSVLERYITTGRIFLHNKFSEREENGIHKLKLSFPFLKYLVNFLRKVEIKQGLFGKVMKDIKGGRVKNNDEFGTGYSSSCDLEQLSLILEATNFPVVQEKRNSSEKEEVELSIGIFFFFCNHLLHLGLTLVSSFDILIKFSL